MFLNILCIILKQVYLHVITYNTSAIRFYRKNNYTELRIISEFYHFNDKYHDSYLYVRYLNNYKAPLHNRVWSTARYSTHKYVVNVFYQCWYQLVGMLFFMLFNNATTRVYCYASILTTLLIVFLLL